MSELNQLLESIRKDIQVGKDKLVELATVEKYLLEKLGTVSATRSESNGQLETSSIGHRIKMTQLEAARKVLEEAGRTMSTWEITDEIIRRGYCPDAPPRNKLKNNLFSIMRKRSNLFRKAGRGLWGLVKAESQSTRQHVIAPSRKSRRKGNIAEAIKDVVSASPGREYTTGFFFDALKGGGVAVLRPTIKSAVKRLVDEGFLDVLVQGTGRKLSVFKKKS
jgi:hypothetical protein